MTRAITLIDCLKKIDKVYNISNRPEDRVMLPLITFRKIMQLYPEDGPIISNERNLREKYKAMRDFGIINQVGVIYRDEFLRWVGA